jgi:hypothetical protein
VPENGKKKRNLAQMLQHTSIRSWAIEVLKHWTKKEFEKKKRHSKLKNGATMIW